jgi:3-methyladenine DNA glycosylase AlkD
LSDNKKLTAKLCELARSDDKCREFNARIVNDLDENVEFIGVRTPDLRKIAKELARGDWQGFLRDNDWCVFEMKQIAFLLPSYLKLDFEEYFAVIDGLISQASSWANCDALGCQLAFDKRKIWGKISEYLGSDNGWEVRIGLNFAFSNFLDEENIERTLAAIQKIDARYREKASRGSLNYYVKMMLAWTLAEAAIKHRAKVEKTLLQLDPETAKYVRQKMRDSFRIA